MRARSTDRRRRARPFRGSARAALGLAALGLAALAGCGGSGEGDEDRPARARRASEPTVVAPAEPPLFDPEGRLLPSESRVAGLTLPRGLSVVREGRAEHVYETDVPLAKVIAYFGPRLFTAEVDRVGSGAVYRNARPLEARGAVVLLDVSVMPAASGTQVQVHELPPAPADPRSPGAVEARRRGYRALD